MFSIPQKKWLKRENQETVQNRDLGLIKKKNKVAQEGNDKQFVIIKRLYALLFVVYSFFYFLHYLIIVLQLTDMQTEIRQQQNNLNNQTNDEQCSDLDIFQMLSSVLVTIAKSEQILQCMREILVMDPSFTPMSLFKYLTTGSTQLSRKNIISFLDENNLVNDDQETDDLIKKILNRYGINSSNGIAYTSFLSFIYPYNSGVLRELLSNRIKKYPEMDKMNKNYRPSDSVITAFLLLLEEEIKVEKKVEVQINDSRFPGKERLKKVIKSIKKASQKTTQAVVQKSEHMISMLEIRNFVKAFIEVEDHLFLDLGRRLGLNKSGQVSLQNLQNMLKKIKKSTIQNQVNQNQNNEQQQTNKQNGQNPNQLRGESRQARQRSFKQQLYRQLANTLNVSNNPANRSKTPRTKSAHRGNQQHHNIYQNKNRTPKKKSPAKHTDLSGLDNSANAIESSGYYINQNLNQSVPYRGINNRQSRIGRQAIVPGRHAVLDFQRKAKANKLPEDSTISVTALFRQFVQIFLKGHKQIQRCKSKLAAFGSIDYLSLFKTLDNGRGVVDAEGLHRFYTKLSGIPTDYDFQLIIQRFAQPEEKWLSYSQFSDIFKCPTTQSVESKSSCAYNQINGIRLHPQSIRLLAQIIYLTLDLEHQIKKILRRFKKTEIEWLFSEINIDSESKGFINYQELKKFLGQRLNMSMQMIDLMALLKRLDKSKNGVVVREQFLIS